MARIVATTPGGISENRIRTKRVTTGSIAGNGEATVTVIWDLAFADSNYTAVVSVLEDSTIGLQVRRIMTQTAGAITVRVANVMDITNPHTGTLHAVAIHDV